MLNCKFHFISEYNATCVNAVNEDILECSRTKVGALIRKAEFTQHQHMCMYVMNDISV